MNSIELKPRNTRRGLRLTVLACALLASVTLGLRNAHARPIPWKAGNFQYVADHKDLKEVLRDLGASENIMTWISPQVDGTVTGRFDETPQRFLDRMADSFGFIWYYDGSVLRVSGPNEAKSATIGLQHASASDLRRAFVRLGISDRRFPVLYDDETGTAIVSGPPRMVELATDVARLIDRGVERADAPQIRTFPLHYAWATDRTMTINGQSVVVPGVASVLRSMYPDSTIGSVAGSQTMPRADAYKMHSLDPSGGGARASGAGTIPSLPGLYGGGTTDRRLAQNPPLPGGSPPSGSQPPGLPSDSMLVDTGQPGANAAAHGSDPVIQPDSRNNAILIRAREDVMPAFEKLIMSLDRKPGVIEIDASIIEISETGLKELGVDWRLHSSHFDLETGNGQSAQAGYPGSINPQGFSNPSDATTASVLATPQGAVLTAVIGGAGRYLLSRISALEQKDNARITASPKVATLDNIEAVMDNKQTFYVPVQGYQSGDLYSVSAGVSLRVLPSIVEGPSNSEIRLDVHIEDGQLTSQTVGQLPVISNSTIDTQALIQEGQSLLIAGYSVDQDDRSTSGVPGLSSLPLIGGLFKFKHHQGQKFQRLFLLTPHVVSASPVQNVPNESGSSGT
ncbi:type III secretion system outer membrane ring subunit SctC [Burkholderia lata]|uniref:type III secretion system outer membrane ring subunit SctC n=1 Tax=Burkholderia lata (strain ATCC 17760 / DSM 23089 / LMG 22485 / NCIMB 9086 / R18194 / 383) TaxID=482957 RepID=UPI0014549AAE|nr:type III secretion system outer membrane ring subunit SctC [Burkholderia lata]VWB88827.1 type III secretion system protein [Burkholderia lata]